MAEFVQASLENMLTELEQLQRIQLLSNEEVKMVIKKRKKFEYKMQKQEKQKNDILAYIKYESSLLNLIAIRRDQAQYMNKKNEIDFAIAKRINKLFRILEHRFAGDLMIWSSHIAFLKEMKWNESIGKIYRRMLQVHPDKIELWLSAGRHELEDNNSKKINNIENARTLFMEGLRFHPSSAELLLESFRLELLFIQKLKNDPDNYVVPEENKDAILNGKIAEAICRKGVESLKQSNNERTTDEKVMKLLLSMLRSAKLLEGGYQLQTYLLQTIVEEFPQEPLALAGYAASATHPKVDNTAIDKSVSQYISSEDKDVKAKIMELCSRFEVGMEDKLPIEIPAKRQELLELYLEAMFIILSETKNEKICEFLANQTNCLLEYAKKNSLMNEKSSNTYQSILECNEP